MPRDSWQADGRTEVRVRAPSPLVTGSILKKHVQINAGLRAEDANSGTKAILRALHGRI